MASVKLLQYLKKGHACNICIALFYCNDLFLLKYLYTSTQSTEMHAINKQKQTSIKFNDSNLNSD